jgi:hypothetical protein
MLASLPLRNDMTEGASVYGALTQLMVSQNAIAVQHLPQIMAIFGHELSPESKATEETKLIIVTGLKSVLSSTFAPTVTAALSTVQNPSHSAALQAALSS